MKEEFLSGDIKRALGVTKERVSYLGMKIPIKPEIEEVAGTGKAHRYSFRNLLQFAIAQDMSDAGLAISEIKFVLSVLGNASQINKRAVKVREVVADLKMAFMKSEKVSGVKHMILLYNPEQTQEAFENYLTSKEIDSLFLSVSLDPHRYHRSAGEDIVNIISITGSLEDLAKDIAEHAATTFVLLNLGKLKDRILTIML
jgi:DNA-binding transcriptional MerR regulator